MMNIATCHAFPIGIRRENAITPTGIASSLTTSRQTKMHATSALGVQDLTAKEKRTRTRNPRMAAIWKK
jgi:hypothetical protein